MKRYRLKKYGMAWYLRNIVVVSVFILAVGMMGTYDLAHM